MEIDGQSVNVKRCGADSEAPTPYLVMRGHVEGHKHMLLSWLSSLLCASDRATGVCGWRLAPPDDDCVVWQFQNLESATRAVRRFHTVTTQRTRGDVPLFVPEWVRTSKLTLLYVLAPQGGANHGGVRCDGLLQI